MQKEGTMGLKELDVELTKDHAALWDTAKKYLGQVWRPASIELDRLADPEDVIAKNSIYWDVMRKTYKMGYHAMFFPTEFGGQDMDPMSFVLVTELMGWASTDLAVSLGCNTTPYSWAQLSTDPELLGWVRSFCADTEAKFTGCWALTEPDHGSDWILFESKDPSIHGQVRARLEGDEYVPGGPKGGLGQQRSDCQPHCHVGYPGSVEGDAGRRCLRNSSEPAGITRGKPLNKLGQRALPQERSSSITCAFQEK